jgi:hypothetical protein
MTGDSPGPARKVTRLVLETPVHCANIRPAVCGGNGPLTVTNENDSV